MTSDAEIQGRPGSSTFALVSPDVEKRMAESAGHMPLRPDVPVPPGVRRVPDVKAMKVDYARVSQLQLAAGAGTTPRHVSFLETARSRPGAGVVLRLAAELDLPRREQNALLEAAGLPRAFPDRVLDDADLAPFRDAIDSLLARHEPLPAAVVDRYGKIWRANTAFERLSPGLVGREPEELVDLLFRPGPWREALLNWTEVASAWLIRQRHEIRRTGDRRLKALVARAERLIGPLPRAFGAQAPPVLCSRIKSGKHVLALFVAVVRFDAAQDVSLSELRIELIYPGDDATKRFFQRRVSRSSGRQRPSIEGTPVTRSNFP